MNPYHEEPQSQLRSAMDLFGNMQIVPTRRTSERGELLKYFAQKTGRKIGHIAYRVQGLELRDLYYMKSAASQYENENKGPFAKAFFGMLKTRELSTPPASRSPDDQVQ